MDTPAVISHALSVFGGNQAALARSLGVSETTVSRWVREKNGIDFESALRIAKITGLPATDVLDALGLDPHLLPPPPPTDLDLTPYQRDVLERARRTEQWMDQEEVPEIVRQEYIPRILDRARSDIEEIVRMARDLARPPRPVPPTLQTARRRTDPSAKALEKAIDKRKGQGPDHGKTGPQDGLSVCYRTPSRGALISRIDVARPLAGALSG